MCGVVRSSAKTGRPRAPIPRSSVTPEFVPACPVLSDLAWGEGRDLQARWHGRDRAHRPRALGRLGRAASSRRARGLTQPRARAFLDRPVQKERHDGTYPRVRRRRGDGACDARLLAPRLPGDLAPAAAAAPCASARAASTTPSAPSVTLADGAPSLCRLRHGGPDRAARSPRTRAGPRSSATLANMVRHARSAEGRRGCLVNNTLGEVAPHDPAVFAATARGPAAARGHPRRRRDPRPGAGRDHASRERAALARFLANTFGGLNSAAKARPEKAALDDVVRVTLRALIDAAARGEPPC